MLLLRSLHSVSYSTVYMYENYYDIVKKAMRLGLMIKTTALLVDHTLAHFFVVFLQPQHETL